MTNLGELLRFDPLDTAERMTGKSYMDNDGVTLLGISLAMVHNARKRAALDAADDTHFEATLVDYERILTAEGFALVLSVPFIGNWGDSETFQVWWSAEGLLLCFDTWQGRKVNGGKVYYNWRANDGQARWGRHLSSGGSDESGLWSGDHDIREGLRFNLSELRRLGKFDPQWKRRPFLWLIHYGDKDCDYKSTNAERIAALPDHVREAITP